MQPNHLFRSCTDFNAIQAFSPTLTIYNVAKNRSQTFLGPSEISAPQIEVGGDIEGEIGPIQFRQNIVSETLE